MLYSELTIAAERREVKSQILSARWAFLFERNGWERTHRISEANAIRMGQNADPLSIAFHSYDGMHSSPCMLRCGGTGKSFLCDE